jgi:hypothetical protein
MHTEMFKTAVTMCAICSALVVKLYLLRVEGSSYFGLVRKSDKQSTRQTFLHYRNGHLYN